MSDYKIIETKILKDEDGKEVACEIRDYGLTPEEIEDEEWREDLKNK